MCLYVFLQQHVVRFPVIENALQSQKFVYVEEVLSKCSSVSLTQKGPGFQTALCLSSGVVVVFLLTQKQEPTVFTRFIARALIFFNQTQYQALIQTGSYSSTGACYFQSKIRYAQKLSLKTVNKYVYIHPVCLSVPSLYVIHVLRVIPIKYHRQQIPM